MIELRNVEKSYPQGPSQVFVLRRIDLTIAEGEFLSIMGPSGAGKSTLLHILGMHDAEFSGEFASWASPSTSSGARSGTSCRSGRSASSSRATTCSTT